VDHCDRPTGSHSNSSPPLCRSRRPPLIGRSRQRHRHPLRSANSTAEHSSRRGGEEAGSMKTLRSRTNGRSHCTAQTSQRPLVDGPGAPGALEPPLPPSLALRSTSRGTLRRHDHSASTRGRPRPGLSGGGDRQTQRRWTPRELHCAALSDRLWLRSTDLRDHRCASRPRTHRCLLLRVRCRRCH